MDFIPVFKRDFTIGLSLPLLSRIYNCHHIMNILCVINIEITGNCL